MTDAVHILHHLIQHYSKPYLDDLDQALQSHFFRFLQVTPFVKTCYPHFPNHPPGSLVESLLTLDPTQKGAISTIYDLTDAHDTARLSRLRQT